MYCPQCSQQQVSDQVRFCPRCGLPLSGVAQLLANGGNLPGNPTIGDKPKRSPRSEGYRQGVILIFIFFVLIPLADMVGHRFEEFPVVFFMAGIMRMIYARFFQEAWPKQSKDPNGGQYIPPASAQMNPVQQSTYLPPSLGTPVPNFQARRVDTAEIVERPSVTENTTKLLDPNHES